MIKVMEGVRVLEVAQFTFVPAAGAILADWGADVIKVEHPVRGDTQRGFLYMGGIRLQADRHPLMEHPNAGIRNKAVYALGLIGDKTATKALLAAMVLPTVVLSVGLTRPSDPSAPSTCS